MKILLYLLLISSISFNAWTQQTEIKWSQYNDQDKNAALLIADAFIQSYLKRDFLETQKYLDKNEINYGGEIWMKPTDFISMIKSFRGENDLTVDTIKAYTMDDTELNPDIKEMTLKIYRMFSNLSIFVTADLIDKLKGTKKTLCLNLSLDENKNWIINSFMDISVGMVMKSNYPKDKFYLEKFKKINVEIPIPKDFVKTQKSGNQATYTLSGQTKRDAEIEVASNELIAPLNVLSYKWVQFILREHEHSDIQIKYMPYGYKYEYFLKDQNGIQNKGITLAFESNNKFVYIQYFSFFDTYEKICVDIDMMSRNIKIKK